MTDPIIEVVNVGKAYAGISVLDGIDFDLRAGEVHALMGENGAGKSTLIKILSGLVQPSTGVVRMAGADVALGSPAAARHAGIATVYQETSLFPDLSVTENIFMGNSRRLSWGGLDWRSMRRQARDLLDSLDCRDVDTEARVGTLSVAHKQQVEISRALALRAKVVILDEPTTALNNDDVEKLLNIIRQLRGRGVGLIYVSHRLDEIFRIADRATVLRDGRLIATQPIEAVSEASLVTMMVGRPLDQIFPKLAPCGRPVRLQVEGLSLRDWLRDISFSIRAGEVVGLAGLVGAGRTTLAQTLFGVTPATAGRIAIDGVPAAPRSTRAAMGMGLAYVPEDRAVHGLSLPQTIRDNLTSTVMGTLAWGFMASRRAEQRFARDAARRFGVKARDVGQRASELSGGNQQKVVLSKWMATSPRVLILDEPTRGIDVGAKADIYALIAKLAGEGLAVLLISSDLNEILGLSHRVLVMRGGAVVAQFERDGLSADQVGAAMTGSRSIGQAA